ncbi:hypothetical protein K458DRAFT_377260 [Lentithecium fluviatile CBS 122367]|uniref:Uncharacterized protein n=1 Tax=Lentithecium fluviatile CBS 122367 TaxID=1168545 RepID=A0A6G1IIY5_9PLEO|nr:hypothetical protein K458DRAFT_377260 [Lentithecium fluviatile CBS 122367]
MRAFTSVAALAFVASICAIPITPAAPSLQRRAEQFRLKGLQEYEIAAKLALPETIPTTEPEPFLSHFSNKISSLFHHCDEDDDEEPRAGDIAPGSLEAPSMLPRPANQDDTMYDRIIALLRSDAERKSYAYEGKELELRRPTGMRHWGAQDKWRLF